jgi:predicted dienelactone hydrolase
MEEFVQSGVRKLALMALLPALAIAVSACAPAKTGYETDVASVQPTGNSESEVPAPVGVTEMTFERPSTTTGQPRILETYVWYPAEEAAEGAEIDETLQGVRDARVDTTNPLPIVMFSHGSGGEPWQSTYLTTFLAAHGFVVVAPAHAGNTAEDCHPSCDDIASAADSLLNRPDDILFVLQSFLVLNEDNTSMFFHILDPANIGISGYSFGGLTALQLATRTGNPFKAAFAMAPSVVGLQPPPSDWRSIPLLIMAGGEDSICPASRARDYLLSLPAADTRYLVEFPTGTHAAYNEICDEGVDCGGGHTEQQAAHDEVNFYAKMFFKKYLVGGQWADFALGPYYPGADPNVQFETWLPEEPLVR